MRVHLRDDHLLLKRHAQDPLVGVDPYLARPILGESHSDSKGVVGGPLRRNEVSGFPGLKELLCRTNRDRGVCVRESFARRMASQKYNTDGNPVRQPPYQKEVQLWHGNTSIAAITPAM